jgi:hypothetical protein
VGRRAAFGKPAVDNLTPFETNAGTQAFEAIHSVWHYKKNAPQAEETAVVTSARRANACRSHYLLCKEVTMLKSRSPLKIDEIAPHFASLLREEGTSLEQPALAATWRAFAAFCREPLECDDERLFFEADLSTSQPNHFYVHFARTCYGREPKGHVWSHEVICDFLFSARRCPRRVQLHRGSRRVRP